MSIKLADYNAVCVNISSGKDSQQTLQNICEQAYREGVLHRVSAVYADTGAELTGSMPHCRYLTNYYQVPFQAVYPNHPLPEKIRLRGRWPSAKCRYCTSDCKVAPIAKYIRNKYIFKEECRILMVSGERREESPHRKTLPEFEVDTNLTAGYRKVFRYRPILDMTKKEVWSSTLRNCAGIRLIPKEMTGYHAPSAFSPTPPISGTAQKTVPTWQKNF